MAGPKATKKSVTPTKTTPKAAKGQKYEYTDLNKVSLTSTDTHNVYGVIIDASFPNKVNSEKYVCSLKIVDPSVHSINLVGSTKDCKIPQYLHLVK